MYIYINLKAKCLLVTFFNGSKLICFHIVNWLQALLYNANSARGVIVIVEGSGHGDTSSNLGGD